jgi:predicted amidophosphoribosyltransferase
MKCLICQQDNQSRAKFCIECGRRLPAVCAACGAALPEEARFCPDCGRRVSPPAVPEQPWADGDMAAMWPPIP